VRPPRKKRPLPLTVVEKSKAAPLRQSNRVYKSVGRPLQDCPARACSWLTGPYRWRKNFEQRPTVARRRSRVYAYLSFPLSCGANEGWSGRRGGIALRGKGTKPKSSPKSYANYHLDAHGSKRFHLTILGPKLSPQKCWEEGKDKSLGTSKRRPEEMSNRGQKGT